jgi:predicted outer membrane protein
MRNFLYTSFLIFFSSTFSAQNTSENSTPNKLKTVNGRETTFKVDSAKLALKNQTPIGQSPKTVKYYDDFILALEMKRDVVAADPAQNKIIEESDWLDKINTEITLAKAKRDELIKTTK